MLEIFGPVPSRRLGQSLGVNNIPPKNCTYACVYCQLGKALWMSTQRKTFYHPQNLAYAASEKVRLLMDQGIHLDYVTLVPDGEPTLDIHLLELMTYLKEIPVPLAVITNGSLLTDDNVTEALLLADWISLKVDAYTENVWKKINRPCRDLQHTKLLKGMQKFANRFHKKQSGKLMTETMLVEGINTDPAEQEAVADFIKTLHPQTAYLSIPTRPPAESWVEAATEKSLTRTFVIFSERVPSVEYLIGYEGNAFTNSGDAREDILSITAVHPMREEAVSQLLLRNKADYSLVDTLLQEHLLIANTYQGNTYYVRSFSKNRGV